MDNLNKHKWNESYIKQIIKIINFYNTCNKTTDSLPIILLYGPNGSGKTRIVESVCSSLSLNLSKINGVNIAGESASAVEKRLEIYFEHSIVDKSPCLILIKSFQYVFKLKDINEFNRRIVSSFFKLINEIKIKQKENFFIICTATNKNDIDSTILNHFNYELEVKSLSEDQRKSIFEEELFKYFDEKKIDFETELDQIIKKTSGLYYGEMVSLLDIIKNDLRIDNDDAVNNKIQKSLSKFSKNRKFQQENKLNIDDVGWSDVGGLNEIKQIIKDTILLPLKYPLLFSSNDKKIGITRSGILLYGPPGTGKTLLAKAISNECDLNFLSVKGPELLDMYVGQTELNVRNLFERARSNSPCIMFFDELDSLAPIRGRAGDSGGVMDRVVSQLLTEVDGLDKYASSDKPSQIFLIGATNRPDLIDPSLLRPGRFDKLVYVPISCSLTERISIFKALIRKLPIDNNFNIDYFVENCPLYLSGADFYSITNKARQNALKRLINSIEIDDLKTLNDDKIVLNEEDFSSALKDFQPTMNEDALLEYNKYFLNFSNKQ